MVLFNKNQHSTQPRGKKENTMETPAPDTRQIKRFLPTQQEIQKFARKARRFIPKPLQELAVLWGVKETVGTAAGAAVVADLAPEPGTQNDNFFQRFWALIKDAPKVPEEVLGSIGRIRLSDTISGGGKTPKPLPGETFHNLSLHASLSPSEFEGTAFGAAIAAGSAIALGAIEVTKHVVAKHRLGEDSRIEKIPRDARKEIIRELIKLEDSLPLDDPDNILPTIKEIERLIRGEGTIGTTLSKKGEIELTFNKQPASGLSPLPEDIRSAIGRTLEKHALEIHGLTADAINVAAVSGKGNEASCNRLLLALPAKETGKDMEALASGMRLDPATMSGGQIQAMGSSTPTSVIARLKQIVKKKDQAQELAATGQGKSTSLN